jgi:hypothetical protein
MSIHAQQTTPIEPPPPPDPTAAALVGRLDLEHYKATIKGLTKFGDRRQGTDRNRAALDWIEEQLKSYGCTNTQRVQYNYEPPAQTGRGQPRRRRSAPAAPAAVGFASRTPSITIR